MILDRLHNLSEPSCSQWQSENTICLTASAPLYFPGDMKVLPLLGGGTCGRGSIPGWRTTERPENKSINTIMFFSVNSLGGKVERGQWKWEEQSAPHPVPQEVHVTLAGGPSLLVGQGPQPLSTRYCHLGPSSSSLWPQLRQSKCFQTQPRVLGRQGPDPARPMLQYTLEEN